MRHPIARFIAASCAAAGVLAVPLGLAGTQGFGTPAPGTTLAGCPDGQTGVIYGCAPFCVEGKALDLATGLCMPVAPPPPPPPTPRY